MHISVAEVIHQYGKKWVIAQSSKLKGYCLTQKFWICSEWLRFCTQSNRGFCLPILALPRCWKPSASRAGPWEAVSAPRAEGWMMHARQIQSCWQEGVGSDLDLSFKYRNVYNSMRRVQSHDAALKWFEIILQQISVHREISRTSSYIRSGVIWAFKRLHHRAMIPKSLISLLYCYGFRGISKATCIIKAECMKTTFWYQNQEKNIQRRSRGDNKF